MKKFAIEIKWGILFSIVSIVWMILEKTVGLHDIHVDKQLRYSYLFAFVAIGIYVLALLDKKKQFYKGNMTWKQGFITGIIISFVVSILSPLVNYITFTYITPSFFENIIQYNVSHKIQTQTQAEAYFCINSYILQGISGGLSMGVLTAALVAFFVKTKKNRNEK